MAISKIKFFGNRCDVAAHREPLGDDLSTRAPRGHQRKQHDGHNQRQPAALHDLQGVGTEEGGIDGEEVKEERWHRFMAAQQQISARRLQLRVDKDIAVIIDEIDGEQAIGRSMADAPEIDGRVYLPAGKGAKKLKIGEIVTARVTDADEYDLWAEPR